MPRKRARVNPSVFDAVRRDTSLTPDNELAVALRPEWVWAAQILTRLDQERPKADFGQRYLSAISHVTPQQPDREAATATDRAFDDLLTALRARRSRRSTTRIALAAAQLIDEADAQGCMSIANAIATPALWLCRDARPTAYGGLLWRGARARRIAGDLTTAEKYYMRAVSIGRRHTDHALIASSALGLGTLARERGNIDVVIRRYEEAHEHAQLSKSRKLQIHAHQGMQIAANVVGDHAAEVRHVWLAYSLSIGDPAHEYEALQNVAWFACQAGIASEALPALQRVLAEAPLKPALRLHYLCTTATAAAQCHRKDVVDQIRAELDRFKGAEANPQEYGLALIALSEALEWLGDKLLARQYRRDARAIAKRFGIYELLQRMASPQVRAPTAYPIDSETSAELDDVRRALRTIAGGVLGSSTASAESVSIDHRTEA